MRQRIFSAVPASGVAFCGTMTRKAAYPACCVRTRPAPTIRMTVLPVRLMVVLLFPFMMENSTGLVSSWRDTRPFCQLEGHKTILYRSDLSGANREEVLQLDWQKVILTHQPQRYVIHRGYLYMLGESSEVDGEEAQYSVSLLAVPLEGGQEPAVLYEQKVNTYYEVTYRFVGNSVYLEMVTKAGDTWDITISRYDTQEKTWEKIYEEKNGAVHIGRMWVTEQGEIYLPGIGDNQAYIWRLEGGSRKQTASWETAAADMPDLLDGIAAQFTLREEVRWLDVVSFTGEHLYSGVLFPNSVPGLKKDPGVASGDPAKDYTRVFIGGDREKLIVNLLDFLGGESNTILLDLTDNLKPTVLWSDES